MIAQRARARTLRRAFRSILEWSFSQMEYHERAGSSGSGVIAANGYWNTAKEEVLWRF